MKPTDLGPWIRGCATSAKGWSLRQLVTRNDREEHAPVEDWPADAGEDADALARAVVASAQTDADDTGATCRYVFVALDADGRPIRRRVWRVAGENFTEDAAPAEEPTARGVLTALMRHTEARERIGAYSQGELLKHYKEALREAREEIADLRSREVENIKLLRDLTIAKTKADVETQRETFAIEAKRRALGKLETLVPLLASKLGGAPLLPAGAGGDAIAALLHGLQPDQLEAISNVLSDDQRAAFLSIWDEAEKARQAAPPTTSAAVAAE